MKGPELDRTVLAPAGTSRSYVLPAPCVAPSESLIADGGFCSTQAAFLIGSSSPRIFSRKISIHVSRRVGKVHRSKGCDLMNFTNQTPLCNQHPDRDNQPLVSPSGAW